VRKNKKQYIKPTHTLEMEKDIYCVFNNTVLIFDKSAYIAIGYLKYYVKLKQLKFNNKQKLHSFLSNLTDGGIIFINNEIPKINLKVNQYGGMNKLYSYRTKRRFLDDIEVIYINTSMSNKIKSKLKYVMDDIVQMMALKSLKPFRMNINAFLDKKEKWEE